MLGGVDVDFERDLNILFTYTFFFFILFYTADQKYYFAWEKKSPLVFHEFLVKTILWLQTGNSE